MIKMRNGSTIGSLPGHCHGAAHHIFQPIVRIEDDAVVPINSQKHQCLPPETVTILSRQELKLDNADSPFELKGQKR